MKSTGISDGELAADRAPEPPWPPFPAIPSWVELASAWPRLSASTRRELARSTGALLHALWVGRDDLLRLPPYLWTDERHGPQPVLRPPERERQALSMQLPAAQVLEVLAVWYEAARPFASFREQITFLRAFFRTEGLDRPSLRHAANELAFAAHRFAARVAATTQRANLYKGRAGQTARGSWIDPDVTPDDLLAALQQAERDPATTLIKQSNSTLMFRAHLFGRDAVVKRYDAATAGARAKAWIRPSRGRRAWASACTLRDLGLPTPTPWGYLDVGAGRAPTRSYCIFEFRADAISVRAWIRRDYRDRPPEDRRAFRRELARFCLELYRRGVYHADTKTLNILIIHPDEPARRKLLWIDMDGVQPGHRPTRRDILRNVVQLNGSVRSWVPEEDRLDFLRALAREFPWLLHPRVVPRVRAWTIRRLRKEVRTRCGP